MQDEQRQGDRRQWFRDPGHTAVVAVVAALSFLVGGGTGFFTSNSTTSAPEPTTVTQQTTVTATETVSEAEGEDAVEFGSATTGLEELDEGENVDGSTYSTFGNRSIGRKVYGDAVLVEVWPGEREDLTIFTKGRFSAMHFVVGIDAEAECPSSRAVVSIEDESGRVLWGPKEVGIRNPVTRSIPIPRPLQVILVQRSNETESACEGGIVSVSWGDVYFQEA
jgi:hypothetical protein